MPRFRMPLFLLVMVGCAAGGDSARMALAQSRQLLPQVLDVQCTIQQHPLPTFIVTAQGAMPPGGYQEPQLQRRRYVQPPADGMQEYDFTAIIPDGVAGRILKKPEATDQWADYPSEAPWLKGMRIYGIAEGSKEALLHTCGERQ